MKHIKPGSIIYSDQWGPYAKVSMLKDPKTGEWKKYLHFSVNHSKNFVNPIVRDIHSQTIESTWRVLKENTKRRGFRTGVHSSIRERIAEF